jgi:hypothetical protein
MKFVLRTAALSLGVAAAVLVLGAGPAAAQDKEKKEVAPLVGGTEIFRAENELKKDDPKDKVRTDSVSHMYTFFMRKGKTYVIDCESKEIDSYLRLEDSDGKQVAEDDDSGGYPNARIAFKCHKTDTYKIFVTTYGKGAEGKEFGNYGNYTLTIKAPARGLAFKNGKAEVQGMLAATDARDTVRQNMYCKIYPIHFKAGKTYQIDMVSGAIDSYLRLEDANKQQLAFDDDGGGFPNARIVFNAQNTGLYRIICTSFNANATGPFTLTVKEQ